mmetsp:Transcript_120145/g.231700  ORF Transcript_120145/g.231700 Transcript_120145/m.231700 type:complete len:200 (-) Transcript_120145:133-732(-)
MGPQELYLGNPTQGPASEFEVAFHAVHESKFVESFLQSPSGRKRWNKVCSVFLPNVVGDHVAPLLEASGPIVGWAAEDEMVAVDAEHLLALEIDELTAKLLSVQLNVLANALNDECPQIIWTKAQRNMVVEGVIHRLHESASRGDKDVTAIGNCLDAVCIQGCKTFFDRSTFCSHFRRCQRTVDHHLHKALGFDMVAEP